MYSELQVVLTSKSNGLVVVSSVLHWCGARDEKPMNTVVSVPRELRDLERPVVRQMVSVACGVEQEEVPQSVATQTRREFAVESPPSSSGELESAVAEELMETGGSSVEAVVASVEVLKPRLLSMCQACLLVVFRPLGMSQGASVVRFGQVN